MDEKAKVEKLFEKNHIFEYIKPDVREDVENVCKEVGCDKLEFYNGAIEIANAYNVKVETVILEILHNYEWLRKYDYKPVDAFEEALDETYRVFETLHLAVFEI